MAFDKVKTLRAAEKYLETGKIGPAIKEYCQIVAVDPDDLTALNMLGDLHTRVGNSAEAISCFRRIAEHYREQEFGLKAIAMYRKIDRLQPNNIEIATYLADLYAQQEMVVEARAHYLAIVEAHNKSGATPEALQVLRKIADLDPQNTQIRTKLANSYLKEGLKSEAAECFAEAGQSLVARGAFDEALESFGKALEINPSNHATLKGALAAHSARGTADEAAELIEQASQENPDDAELLAMLASAYVDADEPNQAERVTVALVAKEPSAYLRFVEIARLYLRDDKMTEAVRVVANVTEQMLAEREHEQLLELIDELLAKDSDNVQTLRQLVRAHWWLRDMDNLKSALERLAEAAEAAGLAQDERYALTQLTRLIPEQDHHLERLHQLGGPEESLSGEPLPEGESGSEREPLTAMPTEGFVLNSQELVTPVDEAGFEWNPVTEVTEEWHSGAPAAEQGFSFETIVAEEIPASPVDNSETAEASDDSRAAEMRRQEIESVDFYIGQGYIDIALDTLELLERQSGPHADIDQRRQQIRDLEAGIASQAVEPAVTEVPIVLSEPPKSTQDVALSAPGAPESEPSFTLSGQAEAEPETSTGIDPGLAEVFEEYRASSESEGEAIANGDYETHYNLGLAYKEMDLFEDALEEFQIAASLGAPGDGTPRYLQCCNLLGHCFMQTGVPELAVKWFSKGVNAPGATDEERMALSYETGAAYEQAGDLHRALEFFTEVYGINVSYRSVSERVRTLKARIAEKDGVASPSEKRRELVN